MAHVVKHLETQIAEAEENLRLIQEQMSLFVQQEAIPLELRKNERRLLAQLEDLRTRRARLRSGSNPYRGMEPFDHQHAAYYFGRDAMTAKLVSRLQSTNFVAVVGASGSGKSSLVRAGLAKAIAEDALPSGDTWRIAIVRPREDPTFALASAITDLLATSEPDELKQATKVREWANSLQMGTQQLLDALTLWRQQQPDHQRMLLVIDQFEEFLTPRRMGKVVTLTTHTAFAAALVALQTLPWFLQIITVRADFSGNLLEMPGLGALADSGWLNMLSMTEEEQRTAIEAPARETGCALEDGLTNRVIADLAKQPGQLPLLEFALTALWERQDENGILTHTAYDQIGGVAGAIANYAEECFNRLPSSQQSRTSELFLKLIDVLPRDAGAHYLRQRVYLDELDTDLRSLADHLAAARLIIIDRDPAGRSTAELVHEALLREWERLRTWIDENQAALSFRQRLDDAMYHWQPESFAKDGDGLLRGRLLDDARAWQEAHPLLVSDHHRQFIAASLQQRRRELRKERRRTQGMALLVGFMVLLSFPALFISANAVMLYLRSRSEWQSTEFVANSVLSIAQAARSNGNPARICVATADIGIGCSDDLQTWNVYQIGLPRGTTGMFTDRDSLVGFLTGSVWATRIRAVESLAIDTLDPLRMVAAVLPDNSGAPAEGAPAAVLYSSDDAGQTWHAQGGSGLSPDDEVRELLVAGNVAFALLKSGAGGMPPERRGSLHLTVDGGRNWQQIAGSTFDTGIVRDIDAIYSDDGAIDTLVAATDQGLLQSRAPGFTTWETLLPIEDQSIGLLVSAENDTYYFGTYARQLDQGALHRWSRAGNTENGLWVEFPNAPRSLVVQNLEGADRLVWMLFDDGVVKAVDAAGALHEGGSRPAWLWSTAKTLALWHDPSGLPSLLMGHRDGLLQFCPERSPEVCLSQ